MKNKTTTGIHYPIITYTTDEGTTKTYVPMDEQATIFKGKGPYGSSVKITVEVTEEA